MILSNKYKAYSNPNIPSSNVKHVIMLYNAIIKHLKKAKEAMANNDFQEKYNTLDKASSIILGLRDALDHKNGGEISKILDSFYSSIYIRMMSLHQGTNFEACDKIISEINTMLSSWEDVEKTTTQEGK